MRQLAGPSLLDLEGGTFKGISNLINMDQQEAESIMAKKEELLPVLCGFHIGNVVIYV